MKKITIFILSMFLFSVPSYADDQIVTINMKYFVKEGSKLFSTHWFSSAEFGIVQMGLVWDNYDDSIKEGLDLSKAEGKSISSPYLPTGCSINNIKGTLSWIKDGLSLIAMNLKGKECEPFLNDLKNSPLEIEFKNVPHQSSSQITKTLFVKIVELP